MQFKLEIRRKLFLITENNPSESRISKTILMPRPRMVNIPTYKEVLGRRRGSEGAVRVDALDARDIESEFHAWSSEGAEHRSGCPIHMNRDIKTCVFLELVQNVRDLLDRFVVACIR